jgi:replication factor A1
MESTTFRLDEARAGAHGTRITCAGDRRQGGSLTPPFAALVSLSLSLLQGMLTTQLNEMVSSGQLQNGSILRLNEYICNEINGKK